MRDYKYTKPNKCVLMIYGQVLWGDCILVQIASKLTLFGSILDLDKAIKLKKITIDVWLEIYKTMLTCFDDIWTSYMKKCILVEIVSKSTLLGSILDLK